MRWLVTGGAGFLGIHLLRQLAEEGIAARSLDLVTEGDEPQGVDVLVGDLREEGVLRGALDGVDIVVHAAAALPSSGDLESTNVDGSERIARLAAEAGVQRSVLISSGVVYGLGEAPLREVDEARPIEPYGRSKLRAERVWLDSAPGAIVLRPAAFIGPERLGVFGILFRWVREGRRIYVLGDGSNRYQLLDVTDLVSAILLAGTSRAGGVVNVGGIVSGTVRADLETLIAHAGTDSRVVGVPAAPARAGLAVLGAVRLSPFSTWHARSADRDFVLDCTRARDELGWTPSSRARMRFAAHTTGSSGKDRHERPERRTGRRGASGVLPSCVGFRSSPKVEKFRLDALRRSGQSLRVVARFRLAGISLAVLLSVGALVAACGGSDEAVAYEDVQAVFGKYACTACHPIVNPSLDLTQDNSYEQLVGIPALLDPTLYRVVAGDPSKSFLYLKLGGDPVVGDIPAIGTRMPPRADPIAESDLALVRDWILDGAKGTDGKTGGPEVTTPGTPPSPVGNTALATKRRGTGTISGRVVDQQREPLAGALVTMLLQGASLEGGEEHYRVAMTNASGSFTLSDAPAGRFLLKAYAPNTIYVSRIVALEAGGNAEIQFGLPSRVVDNPTIASPTVNGLELAMDVQGDDLDGNYTLAVNPKAGLVFELHSPDNAPGRWSTTIPRQMPGPWIFMAVDENCNISEFLTVGA